MLEYAEIELGGRKRQGRLSWDEMRKIQREIPGCDPAKILRGLIAFDTNAQGVIIDRHVADFSGLEAMLLACLRYSDTSLALTDVEKMVADVDCADQARRNQALEFATAFRVADEQEKIKAATAENGTVSKIEDVIGWDDAFRRVFREHPELATGLSVLGLADFVIECRRAGGVKVEPRPNGARPVVH